MMVAGDGAPLAQPRLFTTQIEAAEIGVQICNALCYLARQPVGIYATPIIDPFRSPVQAILP